MAEEQSGSTGEATSSSFEPTPLSEVFGGTSETHAKPASESSESDEKEDKGSQKFPEGESSSEEKPSDKPADKASDKPVEKPDEKKADQKPVAKEEKPSEEKPKDKWDSEENPYVKRFKDTSANWNKEHQEKLQLQQQNDQMRQDMAILKKIADGTYDPEKDDPARQITPERVAANALQVGKAMASRAAAYEAHGAEKVNAELQEFDNLFGKNSMVQQLVLDHEAPVFEAMRIMERFRFEKQYGNSPADIKKNIRAEFEKEMRETIRQEESDKLMGRLDKKKSHPSVTSSRGSNGVGKDAKPKGNGPTPLKEIFK